MRKKTLILQNKIKGVKLGLGQTTQNLCTFVNRILVPQEITWIIQASN